MPNRIRLVATTDRTEWDSRVAAVTGSTGFHRWDHLDLTERMLGVDVERYLVERDGMPVGVWPMPFASRRRPARLPFP